jgi:hypothetical protein
MNIYVWDIPEQFVLNMALIVASDVDSARTLFLQDLIDEQSEHVNSDEYKAHERAQFERWVALEPEVFPIDEPHVFRFYFEA